MGRRHRERRKSIDFLELFLLAFFQFINSISTNVLQRVDLFEANYIMDAGA